MHTLDAWRRRVVNSQQEIVPVELVEEGVTWQGWKQAERLEQRGHFRIVLAYVFALKLSLVSMRPSCVV